MSECATVLPGQSCHVPREHREQSVILFNRNPKFRAIPDFVFKIRNGKEIGGLKNIDINTNDYTIYMYTDMDEWWWMIVCPGVSCGFVIVISSFFRIFFWGTLPLSLSRAAHCGRMPTGQSWSCGFKMETSRTSSTWPQKTRVSSNFVSFFFIRIRFRIVSTLSRYPDLRTVSNSVQILKSQQFQLATIRQAKLKVANWVLLICYSFPQLLRLWEYE